MNVVQRFRDVNQFILHRPDPSISTLLDPWARDLGQALKSRRLRSWPIPCRSFGAWYLANYAKPVCKQSEILGMLCINLHFHIIFNEKSHTVVSCSFHTTFIFFGIPQIAHSMSHESRNAYFAGNTCLRYGCMPHGSCKVYVIAS